MLPRAIHIAIDPSIHTRLRFSMPVTNYGVLKGRVTDCVAEFGANSPHYNIRIAAGGKDYRIAVNVKSTEQSNSELLYYIDDNFRHAVTGRLSGLAEGYTALQSRAGTPALDYIRSNLFDRTRMRKLPFDLPGPDNDLNEKIDFHVRRAKNNPNVIVHAFGAKFGPEPGKDEVFHFSPKAGIHDIHMNQGNPPPHDGDNGVFQDGALLLNYRNENRWVAIYLAFQSQIWHTDDRTGQPEQNAPSPGPIPTPSDPDFKVRLVAALINPAGSDAGKETVTLINTTPKSIDLTGWSIVNGDNASQVLAGSIAPGESLRIVLPSAVTLANSGGTITLLDARGLKVDGVAYTGAQAQAEGATVLFGR
ncbi:MAG: hypothetical protein JWQ98_3437 [Chlorobi bacterium]|nr:hypothetical protein [Chlorobiota bacterium]